MKIEEKNMWAAVRINNDEYIEVYENKINAKRKVQEFIIKAF